jgi:dATP pyrophosphohydrolase
MLLRRVINRELGIGDFWQGVTGGLEEGENAKQAALRELSEETGFVHSSLEKLDYFYSFPVQDEWRKMYSPGTVVIVEHVFIAIVERHEEPTLSEEHDKWKWCTLDQALQLLIYPGNIQALKKCAIYLNSKSSVL